MQEHKERAHALLSASGASRWIACNKSARLEESFEESTSSYAEEGTLAHEFAELALRKSVGKIELGDYRKAVNKLKKSEHYSSEMPDEVKKYTDYVIRQFNAAKRKTPSATLLIEEKVSLGEYIPEGFGTCDANVIADGTLEVTDLKYGKGVRIDAEANSQLRLYGLGALAAYWLCYDIKRVRLTIVQPRLDHISSDEMTVEELLGWGEETVKPAAIKAWEGEGSHKAGPHCKWCRAAPRCAKLAEESLKIAKNDFADPSLLDDDELIEAYLRTPQLVDWANKVSAYLLAEALKGKKWPEHKLVAGRSNRAWKDKDGAIIKLCEAYKEDELFKKTLRGFGDLEKLATKKGLADLVGEFIHKPEGKPTLVHESDSRQELNSVASAKDAFKENI